MAWYQISLVYPPVGSRPGKGIAAPKHPSMISQNSQPHIHA